jgi:hypothetical protein
MSRLVVPISRRILWSTGDILRWVELSLDLKDNLGAWQSHDFRFGSASEMTTFPAYDAKQDNLPMPQKAAVGAVHTQTGLQIRSGFLRFQIVGTDQTEYVTPCLFLGDPHTPPSGQPGSGPRKLLQPLGLLDQLRFTIDRNPSAGTLDGELLIEKK